MTIFKKLLCSVRSTGVKTCDSVSTGHQNNLRGKLGEDYAARYLIEHGWNIIERRVRPCSRDRRCEIDIIAKSPSNEGIAFIEVKTHKSRSPFASRLWRIDVRKKRALLRACANWIMANRWHGNFRFDVIEIYGDMASGNPVEIDHITNVHLFSDKWRFWRGGNCAVT